MLFRLRRKVVRKKWIYSSTNKAGDSGAKSGKTTHNGLAKAALHPVFRPPLPHLARDHIAVSGIGGFSKVSSRPRNGRGMRQNSSPRLVLDLEKQGSKVSSLKWLRKRPKFRGIPRLVLEKAEEKGKIPRLVSSSTSEKFYKRSRPRPRPR